MIILVDYDNVSNLERNRGVENLVNKILNTIGVSALLNYQRVKIKLYGGWYEGNQFSKTAQKLVAELGIFPKAFNVSDSSRQISVIVQVELARSLEIDPRHILENTYRKNTIPDGLYCNQPPPYYRCSNTASCSIIGVYNFINSGYCQEQGCRVTTDEILGRDEQKLVDTMMVADIIYLANNKNLDLCIISSDDDLWTGIKTALLLGANIFHIQTIVGRTTPLYYKKGVGATYKELSLK